MAEGRVVAHGLIAGRFRPLEVVSEETNRAGWYGQDVATGRACLLTRVGLPEATDGHGARRTAGRVLRASEAMRVQCPEQVAGVVDAVIHRGALWTASDWVAGTPLGQLVARGGALDHVRAARIGLELLDVLDAAHTAGITHGELSPGQVIVPERGPVVVGGFGLAGSTTVPRLAAPSFASPEQARDERIGPAADLWALGAILYTMVEGCPPFREREQAEATLRGIDLLPLREPVRAGPLGRAVLGLLRRNSQDRLSRPVVREALARVLREDTDAVACATGQTRLRRAYTAVRHPGTGRRGGLLAAGTALAVVTVAVAALLATGALPGSGGTAGPSAPAPPAGTGAAASPSRGAAPPDGPSADAGLPAGFGRFASPEGFSVAVPAGWGRLSTDRGADLAYRVVLGRSGDRRTLTITYSEQLGPDPVGEWQEVETELRAAGDYQRVGEIRALTYQGRPAADLQWLSTGSGTRLRTFGRGFLIGDGRGYSLRWSGPAADWDSAANRDALDTALRTFRPPPGA